MDTITTVRRLTRCRSALLAAIIAGLACLPVWHFLIEELPRRIGTLLVLTLASLLATLFVLFKEGALRSGDKGLGRRLALALSWKVVLLGGAMLVVAYCIQYGRRSGFEITWYVLLQATLILIPVAFLCQLFTSIIVGLVESPNGSQVEEAEEIPARPKFAWGLYALALVGFLAPAIGMIPEPKEEPEKEAEIETPPDGGSQVVGNVNPRPDERPVARIKSSPKKKVEPYVTPAGLAQADPTRFEFGVSRGIGDATSQPRGAFAPDSKQLVYTVDGGNTLRVLDTDTFDEIGRFRLESDVRYVCWSPDSKRVFYIVRSGRAGVIDIAANRVHSLPSQEQFPNRPPSWWQENEIAFAPPSPDRSPTLLNLDTLKLDSSSANSKRWASMRQSVREEWSQTGNLRETPTGQRTALVIAAHPTKYGVSNRQGGYVQENRGFSLQAMDQKYYFNRAFPTYSPDDGLILAAPDSSRVAYLTRNQSQVSYFKLVPDRRRAYRLILPEASPALEKAAQKKGLFAYVCAPQINSLNGKTIGPNRDRLKGVVMFKSVEGSKATAFTSMEVQQFSKGDVVCDIHATVQNGKKLFDQGSFKDWWIELPESDLTAGEAPLRPNVSSAPLSEDDLKDPKAVVRNFIIQHHTRAVGDIRTYIADFATRVDYYGQGSVSRSTIESDQIAYRKKFSRMREWVEGDVKVTLKSADTYKADYTIKIDHAQRTGNFSSKAYRGTVTLESTVSLKFGKPQVVGVREISRNLNK